MALLVFPAAIESPSSCANSCANNRLLQAIWSDSDRSSTFSGMSSGSILTRVARSVSWRYDVTASPVSSNTVSPIAAPDPSSPSTDSLASPHSAVLAAGDCLRTRQRALTEGTAPQADDTGPG